MNYVVKVGYLHQNVLPLFVCKGVSTVIKLFEHNSIAYDSAVTMLRETGKAAVIHPTGTGKSFIGFKL